MRCAVLFDESPVGRRYARCFDAARQRFGLRTTATAGISPLAETVEPEVARLRDSEPDVLVYFGLGLSSRAVCLARESLGWHGPVIANSSLMFGYARPDWRDGYAGWEYIDTIADGNPVQAGQGGRRERRRPGRSGAPRPTWAGCSAKASCGRSTSPERACAKGCGA